MEPCDNFSMTSTHFQNLACQRCVNGHASKLDKLYSSPDLSVPLFSLFRCFLHCVRCTWERYISSVYTAFTRSIFTLHWKLAIESFCPFTCKESCHRELVVELRPVSHSTMRMRLFIGFVRQMIWTVLYSKQNFHVDELSRFLAQTQVVTHKLLTCFEYYLHVLIVHSVY